MTSAQTVEQDDEKGSSYLHQKPSMFSKGIAGFQNLLAMGQKRQFFSKLYAD